MTVYIEYVLIDNFIIDYLLMKATFAITGRSATKKRLFVCAFFGAVFALILPLVQNFDLFTIIYKIITGLFLVLIAKKNYTFRAFYVTAITFFLLTFLTGGMITGIFNIFGIDYSSEICISLMFLPVYVFIKLALTLIKYFYRKKTDISLTYQVEISLGKTTLSALGFMDTGNTLFDGNNPVILCDKTFAKRLFNQNALGAKLKKISVTTANGQSTNLAFSVDELRIYNGDKLNIYSNVTLCVISGGVFDGYEIILHPKFLEGENYAGSCGIKKVS